MFDPIIEVGINGVDGLVDVREIAAAHKTKDSNESVAYFRGGHALTLAIDLADLLVAIRSANEV